MTRLEDLEDRDAVWSELARAPRDRDHGWRVGVLATTDGQAADARSIVLRDVDAGKRSWCSTPTAVAQGAADPRPSRRHHRAVVAALSWQLRLKVQLGVETAGLAVSSRWARLKMSPGAQDYLSPLPPGTPVDRRAARARQRASTSAWSPRASTPWTGWNCTPTATAAPPSTTRAERWLVP
jgi:pyridoxamine 5'-phosphate oxidase